MGTATITSKGQVTIPTDIRTALNLNTGDKLIFLTEGERLVVIPVRKKRLTELAGCLPATRPYPGIEETRRIVGEELAAEFLREEAES